MEAMEEHKKEEARWKKNGENFLLGLEKIKEETNGWKPTGVMERKKKILEATGPIVISSSDIISPIWDNKEQHYQNFLEWKSAPIITKYLKNWETYLEEIEKPAHIVNIMEIEIWKRLQEEIASINIKVRDRVFDSLIKTKQADIEEIKNIYKTKRIVVADLGVVSAKRVALESRLSEEEISQTPLISAIWGLINGNIAKYAIENEIENILKGAFVMQSITSALSTAIAVELGIHAWHNTMSNACASTLSAMFAWIEKITGWGQDRVMISAADTINYNVSLTLFNAMRTLWTHSSPFDKSANGFIASEAAATFLLERENEALKRNKTPTVQIVWYAESSDADKHIAKPGTLRQTTTMKEALYIAGLKPEDIDGVVTHGTSTTEWDPSEAIAIHAVFWKYKPVIMAPKWNVGHNIWAAAAMWIECAQAAFKYSIAPQIVNLKNRIPAAETLNLAEWLKKDFQYILVNSFWFWGYNACVILKKYEQKK